jgi:hypothetical protein
MDASHPTIRQHRFAAGAAVKSVATLLLLMLVLPVSAALVCAAMAYQLVQRQLPRLFNKAPPRQLARAGKSVLISGGKMTKALQLARLFHRAGHRVVLVESHAYWLIGHRFSKSVDAFYTLPKTGSPDYEAALLELVKRERIDVYIPVCSPVASLHDSLAMPMLAGHCEVVHVGPDTIEMLDDKFQFFQAAQRLNLAVPKSFLITDPEQVVQFDFSNELRPYILKSIAYDPVRRLDLTKLPAQSVQATAAFARSLPISKQNPWIMQEFIAGQEFCTHGTFRRGELRVHGCCKSSAFQINYENVEHPAIRIWVETFGAGLQLTGQASFDFIQADDDGKTYAIECNPRTHSAITMFYNHPDVAEAYLGNTALPRPVMPLSGSRPTYWIYHEVWKLLTQLRSAKLFAATSRTIQKGKDAIFDWHDPLPFFMLHHWQIPLLLLRDLREQKGWVKIDFNIGKLVQPGGD